MGTKHGGGNKQLERGARRIHAVSHAIEQGIDLGELPLPTLQAFNPLIAADIYDVLSLQGSLHARQVLGGTAPAQVRAQVARHRARLG